jgi:hypothetical protein
MASSCAAGAPASSRQLCAIRRVATLTWLKSTGVTRGLTQVKADRVRAG